MTEPLRLGIAGLGTVGVGIVRIVQKHADLLALRAGRPVVITAVSARSKTKNRDVDLSNYAWEDDPVNLAKRTDIDVFIEVMGGHEGPARDATQAAIASGKDVVSANKALLAHHGQELAIAAENAGRVIRFEAAVAGGIPVVKALTEGLAGNEITRVMGVMNGSCNYILTRMENDGMTYEQVFDAANQLGFLEADPELDVGGIDAGHKLALLASIAFGTQVDFDSVVLEGIGSITIEDINQASDMGYKIKLLGVAQMTGRGLEQRMSPCLVPETSPLGQLHAGAGMGPTASAIMGDVMDIARGNRTSTFGQPAKTLRKARAATAAISAPYYLRLQLLDKPGALAKVATVLGDAGISIDRMRQYDHSDTTAPVLIVTHKTTQTAVKEAIVAFATTAVVSGDPVAIRIEAV
jgi:homoserine dehydrogenase